eukprot:GHRQ01026036.1.p1 GENE.GHRQ01026036.1~~GHRQ01026036.1.p1  ORF type:complete len:217 (+),score=39.71 GHRQ01026036.1:471-1121(+)
MCDSQSYLPLPRARSLPAVTGGLLPSSVKSKVPAAVAADSDAEYKDYRSYYKYMCLPMGFYNLNMYDSFGDGWDSGRITVTQMVNASAGCQLLSETMPTQTSSRAVPFSITVGTRLPHRVHARWPADLRSETSAAVLSRHAHRRRHPCCALQASSRYTGTLIMSSQCEAIIVLICVCVCVSLPAGGRCHKQCSVLAADVQLSHRAVLYRGRPRAAW